MSMTLERKRMKTKKHIRGRDTGEVIYLGAEVAPEIAAAIDEFCLRNGIKKRWVIESSLRDWLMARGLLLKD